MFHKPEVCCMTTIALIIIFFFDNMQIQQNQLTSKLVDLKTL